MIGTFPLYTHDTHVKYSICNRNENQEFGSNPGSFGAQRSQVNAVMGPGSLLVGLWQFTQWLWLIDAYDLLMILI
jgi:hypothetical protein